MSRWTLLVLLWSLMVSPADAQSRYPYEAMVEIDGVHARSGPGERFYPTSKLKQGTRVRVVRRDLGGWLMIDPPAGSFSWIRQEHVDREDASTGLVNRNGVVVRVGSSFSDIRDVEQQRLTRGDRVRIIGEATVDKDGSQIAMFKIEPPKLEYRWISAQAVVPVDSNQLVERDNDPFQIPSNILRSGELPSPDQTETATETSLAQEQGDRTQSDPMEADSDPAVQQPVSEPQSTPDQALVQSEIKRLEELDQQFRAMVRRDTSQWDFRSLEQGYKDLAANAESPSVQRLITSRFPALSKFRRIKQEYDDFVVLTRETEQRDAQLLSMTPGSAVKTAPVPESAGSSEANKPQKNQRVPRFVGAGVIQRHGRPRPGMPQHVLTTPQGRLLAYLAAAPGINLDNSLGQAMGIDGERSFRAELQADFILVRKLTPVRLRSSKP